MQELPKTTNAVRGVGRFFPFTIFFYQTFISYSFKYYGIWISGFLCFLPLYMNNYVSDTVEKTILAATLRNGSMYYESSILLVGFIAVLAIDLMMDVFNSMFGNEDMNNKKAKFMTQRMTNSENFLLLTGLLSQPIVAFLPRTIPNLTSIFLCCQRCRNIVFFGTIFLSWCRLYPDTWSPLSTSLALLMGMISMHMLNFAQYWVVDPSSMTKQNIANKMVVAGQILLYLAVIYFMIKAMVWLYRVGRKLLRSSKVVKETFNTNKLPTTHTDKNDDESCFSFGYIFFTWISVVLVLASTAGGLNLLQLSNVGLLQYNIAFLIMELCFINFHLRQVQGEAIANLCRFIEAKRSYVRYVSHELRTPLNSAFLGLKMLLDQLRGSEDPADIEEYETLWDIYRACMTAVDILVLPPPIPPPTPAFSFPS